MSGETAARVLRERFEEIRRAEMARLYKKIGSLTDQQRAEVDAITSQVVQAIARGPAEALEHEDEHRVIQAMVDLFGAAAARAR